MEERLGMGNEFSPFGAGCLSILFILFICLHFCEACFPSAWPRLSPTICLPSTPKQEADVRTYITLLLTDCVPGSDTETSIVSIPRREPPSQSNDKPLFAHACGFSGSVLIWIFSPLSEIKSNQKSSSKRRAQHHYHHDPKHPRRTVTFFGCVEIVGVWIIGGSVAANGYIRVVCAIHSFRFLSSATMATLTAVCADSTGGISNPATNRSPLSSLPSRWLQA